jgi:4-hydroxythreonine-4-phosphate dehydrogenase
MTKPTIGIIIGDPAGIGPEVVVKALTQEKPEANMILVGSAEVVKMAIDLVKAPFDVHRIQKLEDANFREGVLEVWDPGTLGPKDFELSKASEACGKAVALWLDMANTAAEEGRLQAVIMGPVNTDSLKMAHALEKIVGVETGKTYLFLITGPLRVVHLTDHIPLKQVVLEEVKKDKILKLIRLVDQSLKQWGIPNPRIAMAGLNPHAYGEEEEKEIKPAMAEAGKEGIPVIGPVPPDSVFRQCIDRQYDIVIAHYHDQGHIAVKTWGFSGNCALILGTPFLSLSVAHGTAFDIAWQGKADSAMMHSAICTAASLANGKGFPKEV